MKSGIFIFRIVAAILLVSSPFIAFLAAYRLTDFYFQTKLVPYPFEKFGLVIGTGAALWTAGLIYPFVKRLIRK